jgi:hypothetical protein
MCTQATNCGKTFLSLPFWLETARQQLKDKTVASLVCVFTGHRIVARKNNQVARMNGLTFHNNIPCMIMVVVEVGAIIGLVAWNRKRRHQRRQFWVHPIYRERLSLGRFYTSFERYRYYPDKFISYYRMSISSFDELLALVGPSIARQDTNWRRSVPEAEHLSVALR